MRMKTTLIGIALAIVPLPLAAQEAAPQPALPGVRVAPVSTPTATSSNAPVNGVLVLYGSERCPTNTDGAEIVVCVRRSAQEQYRIPKELRNFEVTPENEAWAAREKSNASADAAGIGTCTTVGPGGGIGCFVQNARRTKTEARARDKAAIADLP